MTEAQSIYYLLIFPQQDTPTSFSEKIERAISKCMKNHLDNIIFDFSAIQKIEDEQISAISRWGKILKSLGGHLVLIKLQSMPLATIESTDILEHCSIFADRNAFISSHPEACIQDLNQTSDNKPASWVTTAEYATPKHPGENDSQNMTHAVNDLLGVNGPSNESLSLHSKAFFIKDKVLVSGKYQCLGCGNTDIFLRNSRFHPCQSHPCPSSGAGWQTKFPLF